MATAMVGMALVAPLLVIQRRPTEKGFKATVENADFSSLPPES
jgi:hypothetical protein